MDERDDRPDWDLDKEERTWFHRIMEHPLFGHVMFIMVASALIFVVVGSLFALINYTVASLIVFSLMVLGVMLFVGFMQKDWISQFWSKKMKIKTYPSLLDQMMAYLRHKNIRYEKDKEEEGLIKFTVGNERLEWQCALQSQDDHQVVLRSFTPFDVPIDRRDEVAELTNRLNEKSRSGYFVLNFSTHIVECRTVLRRPAETQHTKELDTIFEDHFELFRWRIRHIAEVVFEDKTAVEVLNRRN